LTDIAARQPSADRRPGRLRSVRWYLTGVSAAGIAAGLVLTGAATGSAAPTSGGSGQEARAITLTNNTSSSVGQLTVRFSYKPGEGGSIKPLSLTYSGGTPLKIAHPALVFSFRLVPGPGRGKPVQVKARPRPLMVIVRIRDVRHFSGKLPLKDLLRMGNWVGKPSRKARAVPTALIGATVASVSQKRPVRIAAPVGLQVGIILGPIPFGAVH
jgi:hypothetical protein